MTDAELQQSTDGELRSRAVTLGHLFAEAERIRHTPRHWIAYLGQQLGALRREYERRVRLLRERGWQRA